MRTQIVILCLLVSTAHSLTCLTYNGDGNAELTNCGADVLCVKPKTETDPTTNSMYACNPASANTNDIGDCATDKCETCTDDYCNVPADIHTCFEDSVDSGIHSMTNTKKICAGETKCKVILPRYDSETLVDTCGACGADENCIDCEGANCNTDYEFGECLTEDDANGAKEFCSGTDSYTAQVAPNEKKYNPHCKRPAYTAGPTKVGEVTPGCGTCDGDSRTCKECKGADCNAPPTEEDAGDAFNCFKYTWSDGAFTIGAAAACTGYYDFKDYCNGPTGAAGENDISDGGCGPCAEGAANCEECNSAECNVRTCISYDGDGAYDAANTVNCNVIGKCMRPSYTKDLVKVGSVNHACGACGETENCRDCDDGDNCNTQPDDAGEDFECKQYLWENGAYALKTDSVTCSGYYDFINNCNGPIEASGENDVSNAGCGPCTADNCKDCTEANCNVRMCISYDGEGVYNAANTVNCPTMDSMCMRPSYGKDLTKVGSVNHGCGACGETENCHECDENICNGQPAPGDPFNCKQYQWDADNSVYTLETDSVACSGYYDFINNCNGPIEASEEDDVSNAGCGPCTKDNCKDCTEADCNVRTCISLDVSSTTAYNEETTENCATMDSMCKRPTLTYADTVADNKIDYGCGACSAESKTAKNCTECDTGNNCNTKPATSNSIKCFKWTWNTDEKKFKQSDESEDCSIGEQDAATALSCNKPKTSSVAQDDYTSNSGCGICFEADGDNCFTCKNEGKDKEACNDGSRVSAGILTVLFGVTVTRFFF